MSLAVFSDDADWRRPIADEFRVGLAENVTNHFKYRLVKLKSLDYRRFLNSNNPLAYALMAKMNYNKRQRARLKTEFLRLLLGCPLDPARQSLLARFIDTCMTPDQREEAAFVRRVARGKEYQAVAEVLASWEPKGQAAGVVQGRHRDLLSLIERRFVPVSEEMQRRLRQVTSLERLDALLDAKSLDDLKF